MNTSILNSPVRRLSSDFTFWIMSAVCAFVFSWYAPVLAQELYALSTSSGLEFYQVEAIKQPNFEMNSSQGDLWPERSHIHIFSSSMLQTSPLIGGSPSLDSGYHTTMNGRILTLAGKIDWKVSPPFLQMGKDLEGGELSIWDQTAQHLAWEKR